MKYLQDPNLYVSTIFMHNMELAGSQKLNVGLCSHLYSLYESIRKNLSFLYSDKGRSTSSLFVLPHEPDQLIRKTSFNVLCNRIPGLCNAMNFVEVRNSLRHSVMHSTGQAGRVYGLVQRMVETNEVLLATDAAFGAAERKIRTVFMRVVSGSDFITPLKFTERPDCKFCGAPKIRVEHLLFECPKCTYHRTAPPEGSQGF